MSVLSSFHTRENLILWRRALLKLKKKKKKHHFKKFFFRLLINSFEFIDTSMQIYIISFLNVPWVNRLRKICKQKRNLKLNTFFFIFGKTVKTTSLSSFTLFLQFLLEHLGNLQVCPGIITIHNNLDIIQRIAKRRWNLFA